MVTLTGKEIKTQLSRYLEGKLDATKFREWFALVLRDVHKSSDPLAEPLAHAVEGAFADAENSNCTDELRATLEQLSRSGDTTMNQGSVAVVVATFSSSVGATVSAGYPGQAVRNLSPTPAYNAQSSSRFPSPNEIELTAP
jgi:hypothetical protein